MRLEFKENKNIEAHQKLSGSYKKKSVCFP